MLLRNIDFASPAIACALVLTLIVPCSAVGQAPDTVWAQPQQEALAEDLLSGDEDRQLRAVWVAQGLGPLRMSDDVRVALIKLLEQCSDAKDAARTEGIPMNDVVNFEFYMWVADTVADLKDPRAIPALMEVGDFGYNRYVVHGLASFGEQALSAILKFLDTPAASNGVLQHSMEALTVMVEEIGAEGLSPSARSDIVRIARDGLSSNNGGVLIDAADLALALNDPALVQTVAAFAQDSGELGARGISPTYVNMLRKRAGDALSRTQAGD